MPVASGRSGHRGLPLLRRGGDGRISLLPRPLPHRLPACRGVSQELIRYDAMCNAIEAAYEVDEVKDIRDKALAWEMYSRQAKNTDAERDACEIRLRAERRAGELLRQLDKRKNQKSAGPTMGPAPLTLKELGISKNQSSKWQKLAGVPDEEFDAKPTTNGIIRATAPPT
jgi:hypothetical protein